MVAEVRGTFILVFFGCGAAVLMGRHIGMHGIAMAFGLTIVAATYGLGTVLAAGVIFAIASGKAGYSLVGIGLGQNGHGCLGKCSVRAALVFEFVARFVFVTVILGQRRRMPSQVSPGWPLALPSLPGVRHWPICGCSFWCHWLVARWQVC